MFDLSFYKGKKVLVTGHTGFKGAWLCQLLLMAGADVTGYALDAPTAPSLFELCRLSEDMNSIKGDIRNLDYLKKIVADCQPEIVIHMAAQALVRYSYQRPVYTYETNVMGTVNVLECIRLSESVKSVVNVTTDKVYLNREWGWPYRESDELNGYDPYSNSKSCSELVTSGYMNSFLKDRNVSVSTVRAGNVIGGGDFAADRIIPDCIRAVARKEDIVVRNPCSVRPYQHVLEPLSVYLMLAKAQYEDNSYAGCYNVGPEEAEYRTTGDLVKLFCGQWKAETGEAVKWVSDYEEGPHEAGVLRLDCSKLKNTFKQIPRLHIEKTMEKIVQWYNVFLRKGNVRECTRKQVEELAGNL